MSYVIVGGFGLLTVAIQVLLMRAVSRARSGGRGGALLSLKLVLWAVYFIALGARAREALLLGGGVAVIGYLAAAFWWMLRLRKEE